MTSNESTSDGPLAKVAGKVKQAAGNLVGDKELEREGRLQEAQGDAAAEAAVRTEKAERAQDSANLAAERAEVQRERDELDAKERQAEREESIEAEQAAKERVAQRLEAAADRIDPESR